MATTLKNLIKLKVKIPEELVKIKKTQGKKRIVLVSGCFDIIHADHVEFLAWSRMLGDYLVVAINSDKSVRRLKGNYRPIVSLKDRVKLTVVNCFVDYIVVFNELNVVNIIKTLKPDVFAKGHDYVLEKSEATKTKKAMNQDERRAVESYGGKIYFLDKPPKYSTTRILELIKKRF